VVRISRGGGNSASGLESIIERKIVCGSQAEMGGRGRVEAKRKVMVSGYSGGKTARAGRGPKKGSLTS